MIDIGSIVATIRDGARTDEGTRHDGRKENQDIRLLLVFMCGVFCILLYQSPFYFHNLRLLHVLLLHVVVAVLFPTDFYS